MKRLWGLIAVVFLLSACTGITPPDPRLEAAGSGTNARNMSTYPELGTPATSSDYFFCGDSSTSVHGSRLLFSGLSTDALNGQGGWTDLSAITDPTGLEILTEGGNTGWRLIDRNPTYYGDIGDGAVDLSYSNVLGTTKGARGDYSFCSGTNTTAYGAVSYAEGSGTRADGNFSHAEGYFTISSGTQSHAEGNQAYAGGDSSHAEGYGTYAYSDYSHAEGQGTKTHASAMAEHVVGKFNLADSSLYIMEVGIGTSDGSRANAFSINTSGVLLAPEFSNAEVEAYEPYGALATVTYANATYGNWVAVPSTSTDSCNAGDFAASATYIYVCYQDDHWTRSSAVW